MSRLPWVTVGFVILCVGTALSGLGEQWLTYDRAHAGQLWRYATANIVHHDNYHLLTNVLAFILLAGTLEHRKSPGVLIALILVTSLASTATLHFWLPAYGSFAGASCISYAILGYLLFEIGRAHV